MVRKVQVQYRCPSHLCDGWKSRWNILKFVSGNEYKQNMNECFPSAAILLTKDSAPTSCMAKLSKVSSSHSSWALLLTLNCVIGNPAQLLETNWPLAAEHCVNKSIIWHICLPEPTSPHLFIPVNLWNSLAVPTGLPPFHTTPPVCWLKARSSLSPNS